MKLWKSAIGNCPHRVWISKPIHRNAGPLVNLFYTSSVCKHGILKYNRIYFYYSLLSSKSMDEWQTKTKTPSYYIKIAETIIKYPLLANVCFPVKMFIYLKTKLLEEQSKNGECKILSGKYSG